MQYIPIKTGIMQPPKDDLFRLIDEHLTDLEEGDIVLVTSKIVAIHEARCVPVQDTRKDDLIMQEAEYILTRKERRPLTIVHNALISSAGIDESNGSGYYVLLPKDPFASAQRIYEYLKEKFHLKNIGVIITDSHSLPFRYGAMSISIGCWGFVPVLSHIGKPDLFGRPMQYSLLNLVDSIAAGSAIVSGECDESQPIVIARGVPDVTFTDTDIREKLLILHEEDIYKPLFKDFTRREKDLD